MFYIERAFNPDIMIFKLKRSFKIIVYLLAITGILMIIAGLLLLSGETAKTGFIICGIGVFIFSGGMLAAGYYNKLPQRLEFNLSEKIIHIYFPGNKEERMSFGEIDKFTLRYYRESGYIVSMRRKNGAYWDLINTGFKGKATRVLGMLNDRVRPGSQAVEETQEAVLPKMVVQRDVPGGHAFLWKENISFRNICWTVCLISGAALFAYGFTLPWISLLIAVFIIPVVAVFAISHLRYSVLLIGPAECSYGFTGSPAGFSGNLIKKKVIRTLEVTNVSFSIDNVLGSYSIVFFDRSSDELYGKLHTGDINLTDIPGVISGMKKVFSLRLAEWNTYDILSFECIIAGQMAGYKRKL